MPVRKPTVSVRKSAVSVRKSAVLVRKANVVSLESMARAVKAGVKIAAARHKVEVETATFVHPQEFVGVKLKDFMEIKDAYKLAVDVTRGIKLKGLAMDPVVTMIGKKIWVGFIDRNQTSKIISR